VIINIRGTSGSGKTYTTRAFMDKYGPSAEIWNKDIDKAKPIAHVVFYNMVPVYFIGSYRNACGGCDNVDSQDTMCNMIRHFSQLGHVIAEGLLMSHSTARYLALHDEMAEYGIPMVFAYMDTSLEDCIERVKARRISKGNMKPLNTANTESTYHSTWGTKEKLEAEGVKTVIIDHTKDPVIQIERILNQDDGLLYERSCKVQSFN